MTTEERLARLAERRASNPTGPPSAATSARPTLPDPAARKRAKRRHPAKGSRIAALGLSIAATSAMSFAFANADAAHAALLKKLVLAKIRTGTVTAVRTTAAQTAATTPATAATTPATTATTPATTATTPATTATTKAAATAGGTFVGAESSNKWGPVQVKITVAGSRITNVTAIHTPASKPKSVRINDRAVPMLESEALTAQSAQINTISGATYTSDSYAMSLQSALDAASAAGVTVA